MKIGIRLNVISTSHQSLWTSEATSKQNVPLRTFQAVQCEESTFQHQGCGFKPLSGTNLRSHMPQSKLSPSTTLESPGTAKKDLTCCS